MCIQGDVQSLSSHVGTGAVSKLQLWPSLHSTGWLLYTSPRVNELGYFLVEYNFSSFRIYTGFASILKVSFPIFNLQYLLLYFCCVY